METYEPNPHLFTIFRYAATRRQVPSAVIFEDVRDRFYPADDGPFLLSYVDIVSFQRKRAVAELERAPLVA
jgi:hypothetical protein